jgi:hypothetical protein
MPGMQRDMSESTARVNGDRADSPNGIQPTETLDAVIVGAGFAGVYILVSLSNIGIPLTSATIPYIDQFIPPPVPYTNAQPSTNSAKQASQPKSSKPAPV